MADYPQAITIHECSNMKNGKIKWLACLSVASLLQGSEPLEYYRTPGLGVSWRKIDLHESEYEGKKIKIPGWLYVSESEQAPILTLYETREAFEAGDFTRSICVWDFGEWCRLSGLPEGFRGLLNGHFATITGVFELDASGDSLGVVKKLDSVYLHSTNTRLHYSPLIESNRDKK